jgi:hypothetical protein
MENRNDCREGCNARSCPGRVEAGRAARKQGHHPGAARIGERAVMKRVILFGLAALVAVGAAGYGVFWLLQTCRPLDRLFGLSGCTEVMRIANFEPLRMAAISAPDEAGHVSFFGRSLMEGGWQPALVRLDLDQGRELARLPVAAQDGYGQLIFAEDGRRAILICITAEPCLGDESNAAIVSVEDGTILETRERTDEDFVYFPGDPRADLGNSWVQLFVADGQRVLDVGRDDTIALLDADGDRVATLFEGRRNDILRSGVSVSPSGTRVALFDYARPGVPARLYVWDALSGENLVERDLGPDYHWRTTPTWTPDETRLTLVRRDARDTLLELHRVP